MAESIAEFGVGRQLKDLGSDRGAETYDFTLIAKERQEERMRNRRQEKEDKGQELDNEMESYWSRKEEDVKEDVEGEMQIKEEEMQEDVEDEIKDEKRGTKRSVKERLGSKKIMLDRFKNETLSAPGEPRQIVDIAEISLVEGSDQDFGEEVAERLMEDKEEMIVDLVKAVGRRTVWQFFKETQKIEKKGGMVINNGARRRTAGGVMLHLFRKSEDPEIKEKVRMFFADSQKNDRRKILAAKKRKLKDFDKEMEEFLSARKDLSKKKDDGGETMEEEAEIEEELAPLPNVLSMIASSMGGRDQEPKKATVTRVSSFKEPEAPPNSVERMERLSPDLGAGDGKQERPLSPISKEERALLDYEEDDFLTSTNDTEDIELF